MKRLAAVLTLLALACDSPFTFPAYVTAVRVTPDSAALEIGQNIQLFAMGTDSAGRTVNGTRFVWTSTDASVATVTASGLVHCVSPGLVQVSAAVQGVTGSAALRVAVHFAAVKIDQPSLAMVPGGTLAFSAIALNTSNDTFYGQAITWGTSDTSVLTVSANGVATARISGGAFLTAEAGHVRDSIAVTVRLVRFIMLTASEWDHTCGLTTDSVAYCWGENDMGQLGLPSAVAWIQAPVSPATTPRFATIAAGAMFSCGGKPSGVIYCWGSSEDGRLGAGFTETPIAAPAPITQAGPLFGLSAGFAHACGLADEVPVCWGANPAAGGTFDVSWTPAAVSAPPFASITAGDGFTCGLTADSAAYCWGDNTSGQLGDNGVTSATPTPIAVVGGLALVQLTGGWSHACGVTGTGAAYCWGSNDVGELGNGDTTTMQWTPAAVAGGLKFTALAAGGNRTCGLTSSGVVYCWGGGVYTPTQIGGTITFASITMGDIHACGIGTDGVAYCWGSNYRGQLGDGTLADRYQPTRVLGQP
jgi:hypothetical protein